MTGLYLGISNRFALVEGLDHYAMLVGGCTLVCESRGEWKTCALGCRVFGVCEPGMLGVQHFGGPRGRVRMGTGVHERIGALCHGVFAMMVVCNIAFVGMVLFVGFLIGEDRSLDAKGVICDCSLLMGRVGM